MQVGQDGVAFVAHLAGGRQQVGHHDDRHASRMRRPHPVVRVLQGEAARRRHMQAARRMQIEVGRGFAASHVVACHDDVEASLEARGPQVVAGLAPAGGGGHAARHRAFVQAGQQLGHAGLEQRRPPVHLGFQQAGGGREDAIDRNALAVVLDHQPAAPVRGHADELVRQGLRQLERLLGTGLPQRLAGQALGV